VLSTARILSAIRQVGGSVEGGFDLSVAADAATRAGAEVMLVGQVNRNGERITLAAELVDVASGRTTGSIRKEAGSARELFDLAGTMAADVRDKLGVSAAPGAFDLAGSLTSSPEAYRQYAAGEVEFHLGRFEVAGRRFQEAVDLDPEFALAYYRLAMAQDWVDLDVAAAESIELGLEHAGRLPEHWQQQMRGYLEYNAQRFDSAYRAFSEIAAGGADIADTYYLLGEISMHASERWDPRRAAKYFEKALELDPTFAISIPHLLQTYRLADDRRAILDLLDRHGGSGWSDEHARMIESALFWGEKRFREYCHLLEQTIETETLFLKFGYGVALAHIGEADRAIDFYDDILSYPQENALQIGAHHQRGVIHLWNGEFESAVDDLDKTVELYLPQKDSRAVAAAHLSVARAHELRGTMDDALDAARRAVERDPLFAGGHYLLGSLYLKADRMDEAESTLARLDEIAGRVESPVAESWRDMLRAEIQLRRGHFDAALETIERVTDRPPVYRARPYEERLLARILTARGDRDEAIAAYRRVLVPPYLSAGEQWAPWFDWPLHEIEILPELARLEEAAGQVEQARQHYRTYLERWGNADVELPAVATVRERLSRLQ
jgi:tetratricopeptide (TPR) repeat protein